MTRLRFVGLLTLLPLLSVVTAIAQEPALNSNRIGEIRKSIALLSFGGSQGDPTRATGFVIRGRPGSDELVIITAAHALRGGTDVFAQFLGGQACLCALIDFNGHLDLMVLKPLYPIRVPPLELGESNVDVGKEIWLFSYRDPKFGPVPDKGILKGLSDSVEPPPLKRIILHGAASANGKSGGPLVDASGKVIGVHTMREGVRAQGENFAVSAEHLDAKNTHLSLMNLTAPHDLKFKKGVDALKLQLQPPGEVQSFDPLAFGVDGGTIDARCIQNGHAPRDAESLIHQHIEDGDGFRTKFGIERLQKYLDQRQLDRIINPAFGFKLLVPHNLQRTTKVTESPHGILATLTDAAAAAPFNKFTIRAFELPEAICDEARTVLLKRIKSDRYRSLGPNQDDPASQAKFRRTIFLDHAARLCTRVVPLEILNLRIRSPLDGTVIGNGHSEEVFRVEDLQDRTEATQWFQVDFHSESSDTSHAVLGCVVDDTVLCVDYAFRRSDANDLREGTSPNQDFLDHFIMRASLSFY